MQQTLDDDLPGIYTIEPGELPGGWWYRGDRIWHDRDTGELLVIRPGTMRRMDPEEHDGYGVDLFNGDRYGLRTLVDNTDMETATEVAARYIWRGETPDRGEEDARE